MVKPKFEKLYFDRKSLKEMVSLSKDFHGKMETRRSVREFSDDSIPVEIINNAIRSAGTSPSGANKQPWHFVVVSDPKIKKKIREAAEIEEKAFYKERATEQWLQDLEPFNTDENKPFLETAPYLIVIFLKKVNIDEKGREHKNYYPSESVGIATGILLSALHLSGLATLTHTPSPMNFLNKILDRPKTERPFLILVTGYPSKDAKTPILSKKPLCQITSYF